MLEITVLTAVSSLPDQLQAISSWLQSITAVGRTAYARSNSLTAPQSSLLLRSNEGSIATVLVSSCRRCVTNRRSSICRRWALSAHGGWVFHGA